MTNKFISALTTKDDLTENLMSTHSRSGSAVLDMFFKLGGSRDLPEDEIIKIFINAFSEDKLLALKSLFYNRDIREGQGERRSFRIIYKWLCENYPEIAEMNLILIPAFGRWDDTFVALDTPVENELLSMIVERLLNPNTSKLLKKWLPREGKKNDIIAKKLMKLLGISPRSYRKMLSSGTDVVETKMCKNEWNKINYNHVPSIASKKYRKAFYRHDEERYSAWVESLSKPESGNRIHAGAIFPHDIVKGYAFESKINGTLEAQWKALPDFVQEGVNFIPVCDVSGSMRGLPMEVCVSLGIYLSQRNKSVFKDSFITFSARPKLQLLTGKTLYEKIRQLETAHWDTNTDLEAVFRLILNQSLKNSVPKEDMPKNIIIISDMQFDMCIHSPTDTGMEMIRRMYLESGYDLPNVIFWNLRTSKGVPVKFNEQGVALISGFSPSIMKNILGGEANPMAIMLNTLNSERYACVTL